MTLKRKRSEPELCSSPSSASSIFSSPPNNRTIDVNPQAFFNMPSAHLNSRTLKRFRDNRPSEEHVHQHTLHLLYSAQQHQQTRDDAQESTFQPCPQAAASQLSKQQSLHRFWSINSAPASVIQSTMVQQTPIAPSSCEDCGAGLANGIDSEGMDVDGFTSDNTACGACGKHVCFSCSVSNLGEEKRCLQCAGRKVSGGGVGWTNSGLSVF